MEARKKYLLALKNNMEAKLNGIFAALKTDLDKPAAEACMTETGIVLFGLSHMARKIKLGPQTLHMAGYGVRARGAARRLVFYGSCFGAQAKRTGLIVAARQRVAYDKSCPQCPCHNKRLT